MSLHQFLNAIKKNHVSFHILQNKLAWVSITSCKFFKNLQKHTSTSTFNMSLNIHRRAFPLKKNLVNFYSSFICHKPEQNPSSGFSDISLWKKLSLPGITIFHQNHKKHKKSFIFFQILQISIKNQQNLSNSYQIHLVMAQN